MITITGQFNYIVETISNKVAELLCTQVWVVDERGVLIASSEPASLGGLPFSFSQDMPKNLQNCGDALTQLEYLRVPLCLNEFSGEVVLAVSANGENISERLAYSIVDLIVRQTLTITQLPNQHELKNKFIHDLLLGTSLAEADILRQGQILGMDLTRPRAVILIDAADYILSTDSWTHGSPTQRRVQLVISSIVKFFQLPDDTICAYIGNGEIAVLKASTSQDLIAWLNREGIAPTAASSSSIQPSWANLTALKRAGAALLERLRYDTSSSVTIGLGRYHPGIAGLARSYQDARAALSLGRRFHGPNQVHCLDCLGIAAFVGLSDEHTKLDLARHLLSPLDQEPELLETLDTFFFTNCCPSSAAGQLSIHRNTLSYRLDKIALLSGLDPRHFDDAIQIKLALLLRSPYPKTAPLCK